MNDILRHGHGVPLFCVKQIGITLVYWSPRDPEDLESSLKEESDGVYAAHVCLAPHSNVPFLSKIKDQHYISTAVKTKEKEVQVLKSVAAFGLTHSYFAALPTSTFIAPATYSLKLTPNTLAPLWKYQKCKSSLGLDLDSYDTTNLAYVQKESNIVVLHTLSCSLEFHLALPSTHTHEIVSLSQISFTHPSQLYPLLQFLRECIVFQECLHSLFKTRPRDSDLMETDYPLVHQFSVTEWTPNTSIEVSFMHTRAPYRYRALLTFPTMQLTVYEYVGEWRVLSIDCNKIMNQLESRLDFALALLQLTRLLDRMK